MSAIIWSEPTSCLASQISCVSSSVAPLFVAWGISMWSVLKYLQCS